MKSVATVSGLSLLAVLTLAGGCADEVPSPSLVEDLRVLAIAAEPPELLLDRGRAPEEGPLAVTFRALVLDPRGGTMAYDWQFCPVESSQTCGDFAERRKQAPAELQPLLDAARAQAMSGQVAGEGGAAGIPSGGAGVGEFPVPVDPALFGYHLASSGLGLGNGAWASAVLRLQAGGESLTAQKRVVLNARDLAQWNPELAAFGWQICPQAPELALPGCLPLRPRTANQNPVITGFEVARGTAATVPFVALDGPLVVAPGEQLRLRPVLAPGAEESFQTIESSLQTDQLVVVDHSEEIITSWFATAGELDSAQTARQLTKTLDDTFTAPMQPPPGGRLLIHVVARDQRGGVGWSGVEVLVN
jgi:hypothetical protein